MVPWPWKQDKERCIKQTAISQALCEALPADFVRILEMTSERGFEDAPTHHAIR
jgi:hypothetical protein